MSKEQPWDRATRLYALALKARENNQVRYAEQLADMAAEAAAEADRRGNKVRYPLVYPSVDLDRHRRVQS